MKSEDPLRVLAALPRPELSPFLPARVVAMAATRPAPRAGSRLMRLYWLVLACVAGTVLAGTWGGVAVLLLATAGAAFPGAFVRLLVAAAAGLAGHAACGASRCGRRRASSPLASRVL